MHTYTLVRTITYFRTHASNCHNQQRQLPSTCYDCFPPRVCLHEQIWMVYLLQVDDALLEFHGSQFSSLEKHLSSIRLEQLVKTTHQGCCSVLLKCGAAQNENTHHSPSSHPTYPRSHIRIHQLTTRAHSRTRTQTDAHARTRTTSRQSNERWDVQYIRERPHPSRALPPQRHAHPVPTSTQSAHSFIQQHTTLCG